MIIPDELLKQHIAILGRTGSGKTYTGKGLVERMLRDKRRVCVLDPTGVWWGLRSSVDGHAAGFPIAVFGGPHADVPIGEHSGMALGKLIGSKNLPAIIDLSEMLIGQRQRLVTDFAEAIYRENRQPLNLVIDEADEFVPQNPMQDMKRMLHHVDRIVRRGRVRGFRVTLISQRPAVLHKNVLSQANAVIVMRLTAPQDRAAINAWVDSQADKAQAAEVLSTLPSLKPGNGWLWAPDLGLLERGQFPALTTFDSSRTPEDGDEVPEPARLADVDLSGVLEALKVPEPQPKAAKSAQADPAALAAEFERGRVTGYDAGFRAGLKAAADGLRGLADRMAQGQYPVAEPTADAPATQHEPAQAAGPTIQPHPAPATRREARPVASAPGKKHGAEMRILAVLAARHPARFTVAQWATLAGMKRTGGTWSTYLSRLRVAGLILQYGQLFGVTDAGMKALGGKPQRGDPLETWASAVGGAGRMLRLLADIHPKRLSRPELARRLDLEVSGGTFSTYLSRLRSNGLIEESGGEIAASDILWR